MIIDLTFYFKVIVRNDDGSEKGSFTVSAGLGKVDWQAEEPFDYMKHGALINKENLLKTLCLDGVVASPEDLILITKEEYDAFNAEEEEDEP